MVLPRERHGFSSACHYLWGYREVQDVLENIFEVFKSLSYEEITGLPPFPQWVSGLKRVWVMGYQGIMGYGVDFPLSRLGKAIILWVIRVYGLPEVWVKRVSTVADSSPRLQNVGMCTRFIHGRYSQHQYNSQAAYPTAHWRRYVLTVR